MWKPIILVASFLAVAATPVLADDTNQTDAPDPALAKPKNPKAQERLSAGNKLYRVREFDRAIEEYKAGALVEDAPVFYYNLGQCHRQLGRYTDAIWHYERFLDRGRPSGQLRGAVDAFVTQMKDELQKKAMTQPPIEPEPRSTKPDPAPPRMVTVHGAPWYRDGLGWGLTGAGAVGVGVASWLLLDAEGSDDDANKEQRELQRQQLRDRASSRRTLGTIVGIGGTALLVGGLVKLALRPGDREVPARVSFGFTGDSILVTGSF